RTGIHAFANLRGEYNFAGVGIQHGEVAAAAAHEEAAVLVVERQAGGRGAGSEGPAVLHLQRVDINVQRLILLFEIDVKIALTVRHGEFGAAAKRDGAHHSAIGGVEHGDVLAVAVHYVDALGERLVDDGIGLLAHLDSRERLQRLQIEGHDGIGASSGNVAAPKFSSNGDAVDARRARNGADHGERVGIQHIHLRGVRNV